ncbi:MAG: insulinase family protein [Actinomycetota bacterium]|nr:insulinase family protein [Actinomycetota bacterium]
MVNGNGLGRPRHWRRSLTCLALAGALAASVLAGCAGSGGSAESGGSADPELSFEQYTLGNGLNVILRKDDRLPIAAVNLWYHVGPANEVKGRTGFAHLFEHMMFQGSGHIPKGQLDKLLATAGATNVNASTSFDRTNYHETVPSNALELALWQESDRMGFLLDALDQAQLSNQQSVVRNERRERYDVPPYALTQEAVFHQLFPPQHPYFADVIGSHADIQSARLADVQAFFKQYYVPNNASLAIVGGIDIAATKAMIEKYFGSIRRGADVPKPQVSTPPLTAEKRLTLTDTVQLPKVTMAWLTPPFYAPGDAEADVSAHLLGGGKASRLYESLVHGSGIAQDVSAYQQSLSLGSVYEIQATARPGHSAQELEAAIQHELDALKTDGPKPEELAAAKTAIRSGTLFGLEDPGGVADLFNQYNQYLGDPGYLDKDLKRYADVQADAVKKFAVEQLPNDRRLVIYTVPGPKVLTPEPPTPPAPPADTTPQPPSAEPWRNTVPQPGPAVTAALPSAQRFELANGLPVYLMESHALPLAVATLNSRSGAAADPPGQPGLAGFSVGMLDEGTQTRDALGIAREMDALGAKLSPGVSDDGSTVSVAALTPQLGQVMAVMSDVVRAPAFPPSEVERIRREQLVSLQQDTDNPDAIADKVMRRAVFGANHPYGHPASGTVQSLRAISRDDLVKFHQQAFSPRNCALVLAGDLTVDQARKLAEDAFGSWTGTGADTTRPGTPTPTADRMVVVDKPGSAQTTLVLAQPGIARNDPDYEKLLVLNQVLGGGAASRVNLNLRERHGYTYGAFSRLGRSRGVGTISLSTNAQTQFTGPSVHEMLSEVSGIQNAPITEEELNRAKESIIRSLPANFATESDSATAISRLYQFDLPPDYYQELPARVAQITAADLQEAARAHLRPQDMKVIAVGDRSTIEPQLAALKLGPIAHRNPDGAPAP